ncbi:cation diffusion facilitator family transporter [Natranaerovirga hydrolytica]|uniref:Cation diffusion facilitator family transporter n=1 Tax=Natranaerovirga hydrolytica TaxID=680378 RepID=A0A4R1MZD1_9FIRM|nr:cation diffusion facilitator family transporter [Natranaerovirga hydrolytica]TCK98687.1 cation diffusion facilitator family transporter [Natranaerovirga hydrolytica]
MNRSDQGSRITYCTILGNFLLIVLKLLTGIMGKSSALLADGLHSITDFFTDFIVFISFKLSNKPPDKAYHYGYGKFETLATFFITLSLFYVSFIIFRTGITKIYDYTLGEEVIQPNVIALYGAGISIVIKEIMYRGTITVGKRINSKALIANAWHHRSDALSSVAAFAGITLCIILGPNFAIIDPIIAIVVSVLVFRIAFKLLFPSAKELVDGKIEDNEIGLIISVIKSNRTIKDFHKIRTRKVGNLIVIDFHILLDKEMDLFKAHKIADDLEQELKEVLGAELVVNIHIEPDML